MRLTFNLAKWCLTGATAIALGGCAATPQAGHGRHHPPAPATQDGQAAPSAQMRPHGAPGQMAGMEMRHMCELHQKMMNAKSPEERRAMMDERMKSMSPDMQKKHRAMMDACGR